MLRVMAKQSLLTILNHGSKILLIVAECGSINLVTVPEHGSFP